MWFLAKLNASESRKHFGFINAFFIIAKLKSFIFQLQLLKKYPELPPSILI